MEHIIDSQTHRCKNCGHEFQGHICSMCAQKVKFFSATPKGLFLEWWAVRKEDLRHFGFTTWQLLKDPGLVIHEYLAGKRRKYYNSTNYFLLIASLVTILTLQFRTSDPQQAMDSIGAFYESIGIPMPEENPGGVMVYDFMMKHYNVALLATLPFLALGSFWAFRIFFRKKPQKLGEHFVMHLFCYGVLNLLLIPFIPFINPGSPESKAMLLTSTSMVIFYIWVYKKWLKISWLKAVLASVLGYIFYFIAFFLGIIAVTLASMIITIIVILGFKGIKKLFP